MGRGVQGAILRVLGARDHTVVVKEKEQIAPHFLRVHFESPTLFDQVEPQPTAWLRFWIPDPNGSGTEHQRAYTILGADADSGEFAVDVVMHEPAGPGCLWAQQAEPGEELKVMSYGSSKFSLPDELPTGYLLIGDAASIPAINAAVAIIPDDIPVEIYLEEHVNDDRSIPLTGHPNATVHWVAREDTDSLATAIDDRDWSDWYAWVACETGSLKPLRTRLKNDFGFTKTRMHAQGYWTQGRAMGTLRNDEQPKGAVEA